MPPAYEPFHPSELEDRLQYTAKGKLRKEHQKIDLKQCPLHEIVQYDCGLTNPRDVRAKVQCWPLVRLFRRCADGTTVETTSWEHDKDKAY